MNANHITKRIEMSKNEAKQSGIFDTTEFKTLKELMNAFPGYTIFVKPNPRKKGKYAFLTYAFMREYLDENDKDGLETFNELTDPDDVNGLRLHRASYTEVRDWFLKRCPEIERSFDNRKDKIGELLGKAPNQSNAAEDTDDNAADAKIPA